MHPDLLNLIKHTQCSYVKMHLNKSETLPWSSKLLGLPYWPRGESYPKDTEGRDMIMLMQINFADMPQLEDYPDKGILQWFITKHDIEYGCNYSYDESQDDYRVVFWEEPEYNTDKLSHYTLNVDYELDSDHLPAFQERLITFTLENGYITYEDRHSQHKLDIDLEKLQPVRTYPVDDISEEDVFPGYTFNHMLEELEDRTHRIGGYPTFIQGDPRQNGWVTPSFESIDWRLLIQLDSDWDHENEENNHYVMWADGGIGQLFISKEDLKNRNFNKVLYLWDCD